MHARAALLALAVAWLALSSFVAAPAASAAASPGTAGDSAMEQELTAYLPADGGWSVTDSSDTEGSRGACDAGRLIHWSTPAGDTGGLVWARCGSPEKAQALLLQTWAQFGYFPSADAQPAFGDGLDLASPYAAFNGLTRIWTQGDWLVSVSRSCAPAELQACGVTTAGYAQALAAIVGQPVAPAPAVTRQADDYFSGWSPSDADDWRLYDASRLSAADLARCTDGTSNSWTGSDGAYVSVFWVRCANAQTAFALQNERWMASLTDRAGLATVFGLGYDIASRYYPPNGLEGITRSWVQGDLYVNVERTCPSGEAACAARTADYARQVAALLPGMPTYNDSGQRALNEAGWLFFAVPVATFLLLYLPQRIYFWRRSRGYSTRSSDNAVIHPDFTAVDRLVARVRAGRIVRRVILTVLVVVAWLLSFFIVVGTALPAAAQLSWVLLCPFLFFGTFGFLLRLMWRPHPLVGVARRRGRPTPLGVVGALVRGVASVLAITSVAVYFFASLMLITDREVTAATVREQIAIAFTPPYDLFSVLFSAVRWVVHALDDTGTYFLVFLLLLVVPVTLAYLLDRFGQRLTRRSLKATLETDNRPYFLYLRGFDEDTLRIDESVGRRGFLELFTPFGRPRFEEVLVEYLSIYGPVIAISGSKQVLSDLGAAKVSLGNDEWRGKVLEWSAGARAVVMSATPREVRAGLEWEIEHVASVAGIRLMLVVSPWKRDEVARRWAGFLARAGATTLFAPLVQRPMPSGVEVMTYSAANGWRGYGAGRRWDWTYAASIITAMKRGDLDIPVTPDPVGPDKVES